MKLQQSLLAAASAIALTAPLAAEAASVKNTILLVSDGASWGTWDMASYWQYGEKGRQTYDGFDVKLGMTTLPLNTSNTPTNSNTPEVSYEPGKAWDATPVDNGEKFAGYDYIKQGATDSAAAATALSTGKATYNNAIAYDNFGRPLPSITDKLKDQGKAVGVVSSVPLSHATPAGFAAENISRNNYGEISREMIQSGNMNLVMGGGHPFYDSNGQLKTEGTFANETGTGGGYIAKSVWDDVTGDAASMQLIQERADFEALADGSKTVDGPLLGVFKSGDTLQQARSEDVFGADAANASGIAYNQDVPTLETMTKGALNHLGRDEDGFFVMIEGGAVDWAAHANQTDRIIEEQVDFNKSVTAAYDWVNANSNWDETLLIVLTDHGNGMPMGPNSDTIAFEGIQNNGAGNLPGVQWHHGTHTRENTLLWAHGAGSDLFADAILGSDPDFARLIGHTPTGDYIANTSVHDVIAAANGVEAPAPVPVPLPIALLGGGLALLGGLKLRRKG